MSSKFYCAACNVRCESDQTLQQHLQGKKHLGRVGHSSDEAAAVQRAPVVATSGPAAARHVPLPAASPPVSGWDSHHHPAGRGGGGGASGMFPQRGGSSGGVDFSKPRTPVVASVPPSAPVVSMAIPSANPPPQSASIPPPTKIGTLRVERTPARGDAGLFEYTFFLHKKHAEYVRRDGTDKDSCRVGVRDAYDEVMSQIKHADCNIENDQAELRVKGSREALESLASLLNAVVAFVELRQEPDAINPVQSPLVGSGAGYATSSGPIGAASVSTGASETQAATVLDYGFRGIWGTPST
jgi:hypothetical protein